MLLLCALILLFAVQHLQCGMAYPVWICGAVALWREGLSSVELWSMAYPVWHCGEGGYLVWHCGVWLLQCGAVECGIVERGVIVRMRAT